MIFTIQLITTIIILFQHLLRSEGVCIKKTTNFPKITSSTNKQTILSTLEKLATANANGLAKHNELRAKHGVPNLILDEQITSVAQSYANYLAANQLFQHSTDAMSGKYGENLYYTCSYPSAPDAASKEIKSLELEKTLNV